MDLALGETFHVSHTGGSTVYLTGWRQTLVTMDEDQEVRVRRATCTRGTPDARLALQ